MVDIDRRRPRIDPLPLYNGAVTEFLTVRNGGNIYQIRGEDALRDFGYYSGAREVVLHHGSPKSPQEIGLVLKPQQAYSRHNNGSPVPHGRPAISATDNPRFPIVRSLFHRESPAFQDYPKDELLCANLVDVTGREFTIVTKQALDTVRSANPTGFVYVLVERMSDGNRAERFQEPGIVPEYRIYQDATPVLVMPVTVEDLPWNTAIVSDSETARRISRNRNDISPEYYAYYDNIKNIYGDPYFEWMYVS